MENRMEHKGYYSRIEYSAIDNVFHGRILDIADIVSFEGNSVDELEKNFVETVDDYIELLSSFPLSGSH